MDDEVVRFYKLNCPTFNKKIKCRIEFHIQLHTRLQFHIHFHIQCLVLSLDNLLLFENLTFIPQIYTHRATNLAKKIFEEIFPFSRKTYIVCKIGTKMVLLGFRSVNPNYATINRNCSPIPQIYAPFWLKRISENFPSFSGKLTLSAKLV